MSIAVAAFAVGGWIAANAATLAIIAVSMIYQQDQMDKMKRKKEEQEAAARAQADAAKGLQVPVSGEPASLNIVYGRNLTGGAVVYQNTNNGYTYASGGAFTDITSSGDDRFTGACGGSKHEYLFMQQAICFADIDAVENVLINERNIKGDYVDADNNIVGASTPGANFVEPLKGSVKVRVSTTGGVADPMMAANDSTRAYAKFTKTAYASCVFWLNRDDPQYNGVPSLQFVVRGKKVRVLTGSAGNRSFGTAVYSNNPVLCLLDYLTNTDYGLDLTANDLDLDSFYDVYLICETVVKTVSLTEADAVNLGYSGANVATATTRVVKLYECNVVLSSESTLRDNVSKILETIPDVSLIWSGGKYKLSADYPKIYQTGASYTAGTVVQDLAYLFKAKSNTNVRPTNDVNLTYWSLAYDAEITDDNIVLDSSCSIVWPNAQTRLNYATVKFLNETKGFKEDSASWPPKTGSVYSTYLAADSQEKLESEQFLSGCTNYYMALARAEYLVRSSRSQITYELEVTREFFRLEPGDIVRVKSDVLGIPGDLVKISSVSVTENGTLKLTGTRFDAANLAWNVADDEIVPTRKIFDQKMGTASNLVFSNISSAIFASSGELSWSNPTDIMVVEFVVKISTGTINSNTVWEELGRVRRQDGNTTSFALPLISHNNYNLAVVSSDLLSFTPQADYPTITIAAGQISGNLVRVAELEIFKRDTLTPLTPSGGTYNFAAATLSNVPAGWSTSRVAGSGSLYSSKGVVASDSQGVAGTITWNAPAVVSNSDVEFSVSKEVLPVSQGANGVQNVSAAFGSCKVVIGGIDKTEDVLTNYVPSEQINCTLQITAKGVYSVNSLTGTEGSFKISVYRSGSMIGSKTVFVRSATAGYIKDTTAPPAISSVTLAVSSNTLFISNVQGIYYSQGRGHSHIEIYRSFTSVFGDAVKIDEFSGAFYTVPVVPGTEYWFWFRSVTKDGVTGPFTASYYQKPGKIVGVQIGDREIKAEHIVANSITTNELHTDVLNALTANIEDLSVTDAKLANILKSTNYNDDANLGPLAGWKIDKSGNMWINSATFRGVINLAGSGGNRMEISNGAIKVFNGNVLRVKIGDLSA